MNPEDVVETIGSPKQPAYTPNFDIDTFEQRGHGTKFDKKGILDENTKLRQNIARAILANPKEALADLDLMNIALKAMDANDKVVIAQARLQVEEEANNANKDLVAAIVSEVVNKTGRERLETKEDKVFVEREISVDLPNMEVMDSELEVGSSTLSEQEILEKLK